MAARREKYRETLARALDTNLGELQEALIEKMQGRVSNLIQDYRDSAASEDARRVLNDLLEYVSTKIFDVELYPGEIPVLIAARRQKEAALFSGATIHTPKKIKKKGKTK